MPHPPQLYDDVLDRIFSFVSGEYDERLKTFGQTARVCRSWRCVGQNWLFRDIESDNSTRSAKRLRVLLAIISHNPRVASLVRTVRISCDSASEEECFWEIVRVCPELRQVHVSIKDGVKAPESQVIWNALEGKSKMTQLRLWEACREGGYFTMDELLWFMAKNLQQVEYLMIRTGWFAPSKEEPSKENVQLFEGCRLDNLRILDLGSDALLGTNSLQLLRSCAPNITDFTARIEDDEMAYTQLEDCLALWAPQLGLLRLITGRHARHISLSFPRLWYLRASARVIPPLTLSRCPNLVDLRYMVSMQSDLEELTSVLVRTKVMDDGTHGAGLAMPVLMYLDITLEKAVNVGRDGPTVRALEEACKSRSMELYIGWS